MKKRVLVAVAIVIVGIQFVPVDREGPPADQPLAAPPDVAAILRTSCYDCHSAETAWPWYARVAPVSWYIAHHVEEAREHLDFSRWGHIPPAKIDHVLGEIVEEVEEGGMPLPNYLRMHPEARVDADQLTILRRWAGADH